jgi:hypothetical protein
MLGLQLDTSYNSYQMLLESEGWTIYITEPEVKRV